MTDGSLNWPAEYPRTESAERGPYPGGFSPDTRSGAGKQDVSLEFDTRRSLLDRLWSWLVDLI